MTEPTFHRPIWDRGDPIDAEMLAFTIGDDWLMDQRLVPFDLQGSMAHARGLREAELLGHAGSCGTHCGAAGGGTHASRQWRLDLTALGVQARATHGDGAHCTGDTHSAHTAPRVLRARPASGARVGRRAHAGGVCMCVCARGMHVGVQLRRTGGCAVLRPA